MTAADSPVPTPAPRRNRNWVWFFLTLVALALLAMGTIIVYNLNQQLTIDQVTAARDRWRELGPAGYDLKYLKKVLGARPELITVKVRDRNVREVTVLDNTTGLQLPVAADKYAYYGMTALFEDVRRFAEMDKDKSPLFRPFARAIFAPADGHIQWYVRRVREPAQRVEILVQELLPVESDAGKPGQAVSP